MMTPTHVLTPLAVALAHAMANGLHFVTLLYDGLACCRICSRTWSDVAVYAADARPCPGDVASYDAAPMVDACIQHQQGDTGPVEWQRAAELPDTPPEFPRPSDTGRADVVPLPAVEPVQTWGEDA